MRIETSIPSSASLDSGSSAAGAKRSADSGFGEALTDATKQVAGLENQANQLAQKVASGDLSELHNAMLAMQKASTALELTVQVRNKVLEAYQEIMRMQV
ncbi:MAG: flagellar hook-basal body complex protein FliE [Armatimonadetes bacterium]|nr:flagellar hook-basal body complex protein FliE [Armatimonadota bacterium]